MAALLCLCLELMAQRKANRYPAGVDGAGNSLTVVEVIHPEGAPNDLRCLPGRDYILQKSRGGRVVSSETVATICQTSDRAQVDVTVKPNRIEIDRNGGVQAGYYFSSAYQLSPWRPLSMEDCSFFGSGETTLERWDYVTLRAEAWHADSGADFASVCEADPSMFRYLLLPSVNVDSLGLERRKTPLGSCALTLDSSGKRGFVTWGKPDSHDPLEVKVLQARQGILLIQVVDPGRNKAPASSWVTADHVELWMGARMDGSKDDVVWQFGIPLDEGPVQVGYGKPARLPGVRRWTVRLPDGRSATMLRIELPPQPNMFSDGLTVAYSQSDQGHAQKRMIATSRIRRGVGSTMGRTGSVLIHNEVADHVTCGVVNGALEITGSKQKPLIIPKFPVNQ